MYISVLKSKAYFTVKSSLSGVIQVLIKTQNGSLRVNSLSASLLLNIFLSFEVGIAHAIANFK